MRKVAADIKHFSSLLVSLLLMLAPLYALAATQEGYTYTIVAGDDGSQSAAITKYSSSAAEIVIPDTLGGYPVTVIEANAFANNKTMTSLALPQTLVTVANSAFQGCTQLTAVIIPDSVTTLGNSAFYNCSSLRSVTLSENLVAIGSSAFSSTAISTVILPESLTSIGSGAFLRCSARLLCPISSAASSLLSANSLSFVDPAYPTLALRYTTGNALSVTEFFGTQTTVTIPAEAASVGSGCFSSLTQLTTFLLPDGITSFSSSAASDNVLCVCRLDSTTAQTLSEAKVSFTDSPDSPLRYRIYNSGLMVDGFDKSVDSIAIPDTVAGITGSDFSFLSQPTVIYLPDHLTSISASLFDKENAVLVCGLYSLTAQQLGTALPGFTDSPDSPFRYGNSSNYLHLLRYTGDRKNVTVPNGVNHIQHDAFSGLENLQHVTLPNSLFFIEQAAFRNCPNLTGIFLPPRLEFILNPVPGCTSFAGFEGISGTYGQTFAQREGYAFTAVDITLPAGIISVEEEAFAAASLRAVTIPAGCKSIGARAFADCSDLVCVRIPESVNSIASDAFARCGDIVILAKSGSYAAQFAAEQGIIVDTIY